MGDHIEGLEKGIGIILLLFSMLLFHLVVLSFFQIYNKKRAKQNARTRV